MEEISKTLKRITAAMSRENMGNSSSTKDENRMFGKKDCPICGGVGYVRRERSVGDPQFGKLELCDCSREKARQMAMQRLEQVSNLDALQNLTFETFKISGRSGTRDPNKTLEVAYNSAKNYAEHLNGWLLLLGSYGTGKTHLGAAVANFVLSLGFPVLFLTVPDLLDWLRATYEAGEDESYSDRFEEIRNVKLLVLDDLGTQNATPWACEKLYQIINHRYTLKLPTLVTTNQDLSEIDARISSRLQDRELVSKVQITASDYRNPVAEATPSPISMLAAVSDHRTFDKFSDRRSEKLKADEQHSLEQAFYAAQKFAEKPQGWLVLMGSYGTGKTHLAAAIGHYRAALGNEPIFTVVPDLLDHLRATFSPSSSASYDHVFNQVRSADLLILDDLGTQSATPWAREKLYQILNFRYETKLPTVITTASTLDEIDPRIRSRMMDERVCQIYTIMAAPYQSSKDKGKRKS
jgi:DNA replication protein DnaC